MPLKVVSGMWGFKKTSWNKLNKGSVRVWQLALCFCLLMCSYLCIDSFNFTLLIVVHLHKRMQAFSSEWLSTNYVGNLHARCVPVLLGAARRTAPELPLFIRILTCPVHCPCRVTLPTYLCHLFCLESRPLSKRGRVKLAWEERGITEPSQWIIVYVSYVWQW